MLPRDLDPPDPSTVHRQRRVDALPPVSSMADVMARLSDTADKAYPIFRPITLGSFVINGTGNTLDVWCCGVPPAAGSAPVLSFDLTPEA